MGISFNNTNFNNARRFEAFLSNVAKDDNAIWDDIKSGKISTTDQRESRHNELAKRSFEVLPDSWRELASKKDKTQDEITKMSKDYQQGFTSFGDEFVKYVDKQYGNGDGVLTKDEYVTYETKPDNMKNPDAQTDAENIFSHVDQNKDDKIDGKEMAALFSVLDMSIGLHEEKGGSLDGKLKVADIRGNMANLIKDSNTPGGEAMDKKLSGMYNFLFGQK